MERNQINIISGTDYRTMTVRLLKRSDLAGMIGDKTARIGIKPNLVAATPPELGATTHPEVVSGILEYLQGEGFTNIMILESSWVGEKTEDSFYACGFDRVTEEFGVEFHDMKKDRPITTQFNGMELHICSTLQEIDFLIDVPVIKGHCQTRMTCALKNMKGLIPDSEKRRFHSLGLHKPIAYLNGVIRQKFIVADNICGDLDFEDGGNPVVMNRIITAADPVLMDSFVCRMLGYKPSDVEYITLAEELGIGSTDIENANITYLDEQGNVLPEEIGIQQVPRRQKVIEMADFVNEVESCSACYAYLVPALTKLKEEGLLDKLEEKICIGQGYRDKTGTLGIGNCTRGFTYSLRGCPPMEDHIYEFLKEYILTGTISSSEE